MTVNLRMIFIILLIPSLILYARESYVELSSWEPEDIVPISSILDTTRDYVINPGILVANKLIEFYQRKIAPQSISRCPFYISCSNYAYQALKKYGLIVGICIFIDRYFYRENPGSYLHYELRETESGVLKLDDAFYLFGKDK